MFKNLDFLGWYTTGSGPTENDIGVHKQVNINLGASPDAQKPNIFKGKYDADLMIRHGFSKQSKHKKKYPKNSL